MRFINFDQKKKSSDKELKFRICHGAMAALNEDVDRGSYEPRAIVVEYSFAVQFTDNSIEESDEG